MVVIGFEEEEMFVISFIEFTRIIIMYYYRNT